jgi:hypothetical protein
MSLTRIFSMGMMVAAAGVVAVGSTIRARAQSVDKPSVAGGWTLNHDLSDQPTTGAEARSGGDRTPGNGGGGGGGYGGGRGGGRRGGMGRGGGGGQSQPAGNPEEMARLRDAMRDITMPPDHLIITQTESMVVLTAADGRTTRLSTDGKKVKDDNTKVERKTKWDGGKLVSEINGLGPGKMTQTFSVDPDNHQLRVVVLMEGGGRPQPRTITNVYDADAR